MKIKDLTTIAIFVALFALFGPLSIPTPWLVPITLQTLILMIICSILNRKQAVIVTIVYIVLIAIGLPIAASFKGGLEVIVGPTGGFLVSFPMVALVISTFLNKNKLWSYLLLNTIGGILTVYLIGIPWLAHSLDMTIMTASTIMIPFLIGDFLKVVVASFVSFRMNKILIK